MEADKRTTQDTAALMLVGFVGLFILGSLTTLIVLAFRGVGTGETGANVWAGLFSLVTAILGAIGGYLGGRGVSARKRDEQAEG